MPRLIRETKRALVGVSRSCTFSYFFLCVIIFLAFVLSVRFPTKRTTKTPYTKYRIQIALAFRLHDVFPNFVSLNISYNTIIHLSNIRQCTIGYLPFLRIEKKAKKMKQKGKSNDCY